MPPGGIISPGFASFMPQSLFMPKPLFMPKSLVIHTDNAAATRAVGRVIGENAQAGDVYLLTGPLGAGKTCLVQGLAQGLGAPGYARSPTFVLATRYQGRLTLHHADLYRIDHPAEAWDLGLDDIIAAGQDVLAIEWADRADALFGADALRVRMDYAIDAGVEPAGEVVPDDDGSIPGRHSIVFDAVPARFAPLLQLLAARFPADDGNPAGSAADAAGGA